MDKKPCEFCFGTGRICGRCLCPVHECDCPDMPETTVCDVCEGDREYRMLLSPSLRPPIR